MEVTISLMAHVEPVAAQRCDQVNRRAAKNARLEYRGGVRFGEHLRLEHLRLGNGLEIFVLPDPSAPILICKEFDLG